MIFALKGLQANKNSQNLTKNIAHAFIYTIIYLFFSNCFLTAVYYALTVLYDIPTVIE